MRIGIDCRMYNSNFTGIGRYTYELVNNIIKINDQNRRKHDIILFFNNPEYKNFTPPNQVVKKVLVNAKHYSLKEQITFLKKLNKENLDVVHFPHFNVPFFYNKPYAVVIHDLILSFFPGQKMTKWYHRLAYNLVFKHAVRKAKKIIAVSENTKEDIIKNFNIKEEKIEVIYNGVGENFTLIQNPEIFQKTLKKYGITRQFLLYTGVWRSHKNLPRLLKAFQILKNKGLDLNLVITGKEDPCYPEVKEAVKELNLTDDVIFPGFVSEEELVYLYNAASIFVFPSLYEGFGFPPLESMRCGTPVVASNTSSIPEICGENALYFNPNNEQEMAEKIYELFTNVDLQADLIEKGFIYAAKFSFEKMAKKTYEIIEKVS